VKTIYSIRQSGQRSLQKNGEVWVTAGHDS